MPQSLIVMTLRKLTAPCLPFLVANFALAYVPAAPEPRIASETEAVSGQEILATDSVGAIGGEFRVSESGAATYNLPIELPAGTAGVAPSVAVGYSSQSGDGSLGKGWSMSGLSAISRCRQTLHTDKKNEPITWTEDDRFCLSGQRLVPENLSDRSNYGKVGLIYRTEIDRQVRVRSVGGVDGNPDYFIASGKDGSTTIYGAAGNAGSNPSEDAARTANGIINSKVLTWAISRFEDSVGNPIKYNYINDGQGQRIISIEYAFGSGSDPGASIEFEYADKAVPHSGFVAGYLFRTSKKLRKISVHNNQDGNCTQLHEYLFNYLAPRADSRLERVSSIKKCLAGGNYCLPETTFEWSEADRKIPATYETQRLSSQRDRAVVSYRYGDVNGDGKQDLIWLEPDWDEDKIHDQYWHVKMEEGDSLSSTDTQHYDSGNMHSPRNWDVIDYNADGRTDLIIRYGGTWYVYLSTPQGDGKWEINGPGIETPITEKDVKFFDVNGDGLADAVAGNVGEDIKIYRMNHFGSDTNSNNYYAFGAGEMIPYASYGLSEIKLLDSALAMDFDGDGSAEIAIKANITKMGHGLCYIPALNERCQEYEENKSIHVSTPEIFSDLIVSDTLIGYSYQQSDFLGEILPNRIVSPGSVNLDSSQLLYLDSLFEDMREAEEEIDEAEQDPWLSFMMGVEARARRDEAIFKLRSFALQVFYNASGAMYPTSQDRLLDLNADGLSDHVAMVQPQATNPESWWLSSESKLQYRLNLGSGSFGEWIPITAASAEFKSTDPKDFAQRAAFNFADLNYDGHADFIWHDPEDKKLRVNYWQVEESRFLHADEVVASTNGSTNAAHMFFDVGGDGAIDYVRLEGDYVYTHRAPNQDTPLDVITSITTGIGAKTLIEYSRLNEIVEDPATGRSPQHYFRHAIDKQSSGEVCSATNVGRLCSRYTYSSAFDFYDAFNAADWGLPEGSHSFGKDTNCDTKPDPILELNSAMPIVAKVKSSSPAVTPDSAAESLVTEILGANYSHPIKPNSMASISYYYGEARIQAMGRGMLGFETLMTVDNQTGVATTSTYRQDFPFIGMPLSTETRDKDGNLMSSAENRWELQGWNGSFNSQGLPAYGRNFFQPYVRESVEKTYEVTLNDQQGALLNTVTTSTQQDEEGNVIRIEVATASGGREYIKLTENSYTPSGYSAEEAKVEGRLSETVVTTTRPEGNELKIDVRKAQFSYYNSGAHRGMLRTEVLEPDDAVYTQTRQHSYDEFGNLVRTSLSADGEARCNTDTKQFDSSGRYVDKTFDCKGRILSEVVERNVYGSPIKVLQYLDASSTETVESRFAYTPRGFQYFQTDSTGSWQANIAGLCDNGAIACPSGAVLYYIKRSAGGAESRRFTDVLGREIRQSVKAFDGGWNNSDTRYDLLGRTIAVSEPFFDGNSPVWNRSLYDFSGRVIKVTAADNTIQSYAYNGYQTTVQNGLGQSKITIRNPLGDVENVTDDLGGQINYEYDARGNLTKTIDVDGNAIIIDYDRMVRKIKMQDPDKGTWNYSYNGFGELVEQTDANEQRTVLTYDELGRKATRHDYTLAGTLEGYTRWQYDTAPRGLGKLDYVSYHLMSEAAPASFQKLISYDSLGRIDETVTSIGLNGADGDHYERVTYDEIGRVFQQFDAARASNDYQNNGVEFRYNDYGYQNQIVDAVYDGADTRRVYQKVLRHDERGNVIEERLGNGITRTAAHNSVNGRLTRLSAEAGTGSTLLALDLTWDAIGNLTSRQESGTLNGNYQRTINETYSYDRLNRLTDVSGDRRITAGDGSIQDKTISLSLAYYLNGNIKSKSDVGNYQYTSSKPHAVSMAGGDSYSYDANGNNTSGAGRSISYSTFDKPIKIESGSNVVEFAYGPSRQRYKRLDTASSGAAAGITQTLYLGSVEKILRPNGEREWKRYIGGSLIVTQTLAANNTITASTEDYLLKDHLGSVNLITDQNGAVKQWFQYDAFGQRLLAFDVENLGLVGGGFNDNYSCANGGAACSSGQLAYGDTGQAQDRVTTRGFTGHETIASMGIIHMNGRIYDPRLGRFLQADPFVDGAWDTQGYNRYSYVRNNPLNAVDPSGYLSLKGVYKASMKISGRWAVQKYLANHAPELASVIQVGLNFIPFFGQLASAHFAFDQSFFATGSFNQALKNGVITYASAVAFNAVGDAFPPITSARSFGSLLAQGIAHGVVGGITAELRGGKFGHGFAAAGVGFAAGAGAELGGLSTEAQFGAAVIAGGTASKITGGKFVNGAVTSAFGFIFNQMKHRAQKGGLPEIFNSEKFRDRLDTALSRVGSAVRGDKELAGINSTLGLIVSEDGFAIEPNIPDGLIPTGYENRGVGLLNTNFFYSPQAIEGAAALAISVPTFYRDNFILGAGSSWNNVSQIVNAPVVIRGDRSSTWVFTGSGDPVKYR